MTTITINPQWHKAQAQGHLVRPMDIGTNLFRCFRCNHWFDNNMELDANFNLFTKVTFTCSHAQQDMFGWVDVEDLDEDKPDESGRALAGVCEAE